MSTKELEQKADDALIRARSINHSPLERQGAMAEAIVMQLRALTLATTGSDVYNTVNQEQPNDR